MLQHSFNKLQYHEDFDTNDSPVAQPHFVSVGNTSSAAKERAKLARQRQDEYDKSQTTLRYHEDIDTKESLVAQPHFVSGNTSSAAEERAKLAKQRQDEDDKSKSKAREGINKLQYHEDFDTTETLSVEQPDVFCGNSAAKERAQLARQRRDRADKIKKDRKKQVLESLDFVGDSEYSDFQVDDKLDENNYRLRSSSKPSSIDNCTPSSPSTPQATPTSRLPYHYRKDEDNNELNGEIVPSDQAFSDMILEDGQALPEGSVWADFIAVESLTDKVSNDALASFSYIFTHTMRYNGEVIWVLKTTSNCDKQGTWGQSSTCTIRRREGNMRVNITHKGRRNLGEGWNTREKREFKLVDLIRQSGEARQKELMCQ
jgi:hypothetical protein